MSLTITPTTAPQQAFGGHDNTQKVERLYFTVVAANAPANYPGTPGDVLDFTQIGEGVKSSAAPIFVQIQSARSAGNSGYFYEYIPNAAPTQANGKMQVMQCGGAAAPLADIGAGNYPAGVLGDTIVGYADFLRV